MIQVNNLTKNYIGYSGPLDRIISALSFGYLGGNNSFLALQSISFNLKEGEIVGIIGRNGAGKSTLLKILTGVSRYQSGELIMKGRVRSILELGVGFNPELSGMENVYYNGIVLGYSSEELKNLIDDIFSFAGVENFKYTPLKNYSTGMIMRLGFALATAIRPDILLVDEALAVGDATFQQKCLNRFEEFRNAGSAILIVSHDLNLIRSLSDRIIILEKGKLVYDGNPLDAIRKYMQIIASNSFDNSEKEIHLNESIRSYSVNLKIAEAINPPIIAVGSSAKLIIDLTLQKIIPNLTVGFHIDNANGIRVYGCNTHHLNSDLSIIENNLKISVQFEFPLNLSVGKYSVGIAVHEGDNHSDHCYLWEDGILNFELERTDLHKFDGIIYLPTKLSIHSLATPNYPSE